MLENQSSDSSEQRLKKNSIHEEQYWSAKSQMLANMFLLLLFIKEDNTVLTMEKSLIGMRLVKKKKLVSLQI